MDYRVFEQRLLDTIFTTDVQLSPATIAFLYKLQVQEASDLLQQAAVAGLLNIESDDEGNIIYVYPNRVKMPGGKAEKSSTNGTGVSSGSSETALARPRAAALAASAADTSLATSDRGVDSAPMLDMLEAAGGTSPGSSSGGVSGQTTRCPFCSEVIMVGAKKCKHCHEILDYTIRELRAQQQQINQLNQATQVSAALAPITQAQRDNQLQQWTATSSTQAALLSFFVPGLGQLCSGRVPAGLLWMMFTCLGYVCFIVPGMLLHILCVINATRQPQQAR